MKTLWERLIPHGLRMLPRRLQHHGVRRARLWAERWGLVVARRADYYSPLPSELDLRQTAARWNRPSALRGLRFDLPAMQATLEGLVESFLPEYLALPSFQELRQLGFGPGYTQLDSFILYAQLRRLRPARYLEVGSGLSTYYSHLARLENRRSSVAAPAPVPHLLSPAKDAAAAADLRITCIEPNIYPKLREIEGVEIIQAAVQDVPIERFTALQSGDVLFIDSSHAVRIDGDVPYLFLEVLPALNPGVHIHIHDIPFPYNVPYPSEFWTLLRHRRSPRWPIYWNEAMLVQAFLAFNSAFEIELSCPLLRHHTEPFLQSQLPFYKTVAEDPNTFSSLWLRKTA